MHLLALLVLTMLRPTGSLVSLRATMPRALRVPPRRAVRRLSLLPRCSMVPPPRSSQPFASVAAPAISSPSAQPPSQQQVPLRTPSPPSAGEHAEPDVAPIFEVSDAETMREVVQRLLAMPATTFHACDTEVAEIDISKSPLGQGRVTCVSVYSGPDVDYGSGPGHALWVDTTEESVLEALKPFLESERCLKVWHNYGFDRHVLWNHGIDVLGFGGDTMHMARLWDASRLAGASIDVSNAPRLSPCAGWRWRSLPPPPLPPTAGASTLPPRAPTAHGCRLTRRRNHPTHRRRLTRRRLTRRLRPRRVLSGGAHSGAGGAAQGADEGALWHPCAQEGRLAWQACRAAECRRAAE